MRRLPSAGGASELCVIRDDATTHSKEGDASLHALHGDNREGGNLSWSRDEF